MTSQNITYSPPTHAALHLQPLPPVVEINGTLAPNLTVREIHRCAGARLHTATLDTTDARFDCVARLLQPGHTVRIFHPLSLDAVGQTWIRWYLFDGVLAEGKSELAARRDRTILIATDRLAYENQRTQVPFSIADAGNELVTLGHQPVVFNPMPTANRSAEPVAVGAEETYVFTTETIEAATWSFAEAVDYLRATALPPGTLTPQTMDQLQTLTGEAIVDQLDVTHATGLAALERLLAREDLQFTTVTVPIGTEQCTTCLVVNRAGRGRKRRLAIQPPGWKLDLNQTNLLTCNLNRRQNPGACEGTAVLPAIHPDLWPGDVIESIAGRDVDFRHRRHNEAPLPQITEVKLTFANQWTTTLKFQGDHP